MDNPNVSRPRSNEYRRPPNRIERRRPATTPPSSAGAPFGHHRRRDHLGAQRRNKRKSATRTRAYRPRRVRLSRPRRRRPPRILAFSRRHPWSRRSTRRCRRHLTPLWSGIVTGSPPVAQPVFFPQTAYLQMKTGQIPGPGIRLLRPTAHRLLRSRHCRLSPGARHRCGDGQTPRRRCSSS